MNGGCKTALSVAGGTVCQHWGERIQHGAGVQAIVLQQPDLLLQRRDAEGEDGRGGGQALRCVPLLLPQPLLEVCPAPTPQGCDQLFFGVTG